MKLLNNIKLLIAADGGASSGKTTASKLIAKKYNYDVESIVILHSVNQYNNNFFIMFKI